MGVLGGQIGVAPSPLACWKLVFLPYSGADKRGGAQHARTSRRASLASLMDTTQYALTEENVVAGGQPMFFFVACSGGLLGRHDRRLSQPLRRLMVYICFQAGPTQT